jgi:hypothetical protein
MYSHGMHSAFVGEAKSANTEGYCVEFLDHNTVYRAGADIESDG